MILPEHPSKTKVLYNEDGNPARANIKQALGYLKDGDEDGNSQPHKGVKASANSDIMYSFTSAQDGNPLQDDVRLCLGDDLKKAQDHRYTTWKLKTLSIGGRLTLLKSVLGSTPIYNMSLYKVPKTVLSSMEAIRRNFFNGIREGERKIAWVKWTKVLASKRNGGLGVSSFFALNRGLLFKWMWRFLSRDDSLWARFIQATHGSNTQVISASYPSLWSSIIKEVNTLKSQGIDFLSHCKIRVGNGRNTNFWKDPWIGDSRLCLMFPRLYALDINKDDSVADKLNNPFGSSLRREVRGGAESTQFSHLLDLLDNVILSNMDDRWVWDLNGDGIFRVKDARYLLDDFFLPKVDTRTRWVKFIPIKLNIFAWKVSLNRLPTRLNLVRRGVSVAPVSCSICLVGLEDLDHLLFGCNMASDIARSICKWWNLVWSPFVSYSSWLSWFKDIRMHSNPKMVLEGVFYTAWWSIWLFRNQLLFTESHPKKEVIFDDIVRRSFLWCSSKGKQSFRWDSWLQHPYLIPL
ncbi:RNA-directed DNA polymerase, eukaryota [Tanacetum coccineum]